LTQVNLFVRRSRYACFQASHAAWRESIVFSVNEGDRPMAITTKLNQLIKTNRHEKEVERWIFSLTPLGVAFVFFFIFLLPMDIPNKTTILVTGAAAGFAGLQSYWIYRGWRRNEGSTVLLGLIGIGLTFGVVWLYMSLT
jgi:hypothetical protein